MLGFKRRRFIVCPFQYRLLAGNFVYLLAVIVVFFGALLLPWIRELDDSRLPTSQRDEVARQLLALGAHVWLLLPVVVCLCLAHSVLMSHRVAGPLHRFKGVFRALGKGDLSLRVSIRKRDYLDDETETINGMVDSLAMRVRVIQEEYGEASRTLAELTSALGKGTGKESAILAGRLGTQLDALGSRIRQFQVATGDVAVPSTAVAAATETARRPTHV